jgi:hypothetical protein
MVSTKPIAVVIGMKTRVMTGKTKISQSKRKC